MLYTFPHFCCLAATVKPLDILMGIIRLLTPDSVCIARFTPPLGTANIEDSIVKNCDIYVNYNKDLW